MSIKHAYLRFLYDKFALTQTRWCGCFGYLGSGLECPKDMRTAQRRILAQVAAASGIATPKILDHSSRVKVEVFQRPPRSARQII